MSRTHDYTVRVWGRDCTFEPVDGGAVGRMIGWGRGIAAGDYLLLRNGDATTRYQVASISYYVDPSDMWRASVTFAPRPAAAAAPPLTEPLP